MDQQQIKQTLVQLHRDLEAGGQPDPELRRLIETLAQDIHSKLDTPDAGQTDATLEDQARSLSAQFAAKHPYLESTLRDLMDGLGKMGI